MNKLKARYNLDPAQYKTYDVKQWSEETFEVGSKNAYDGKRYATTQLYNI